MKFKELTESSHKCPHCGGPIFSEMMMMEKKDACYYKVKAGAKVWPSAYASGRLVQCRKKGAANYGNKSEGKINEFAPPGGDDRGPNDEEILRRLAAQWWSGTEQQMIKAQQTLEALGWEIGPDESGNDDAGVYVYRIGDNDGRDTLAFGHGELSLDEGVAKDDNSDVADISDSDYMRIKGIVDKKYPGYELASLNIGRDGYIEIEIYNYKTHDTKHLKTKSTSENKQGVAKDDNSEVTDISDSDYMRIKGIVDKKYPGYELSSLNIGPNGHIEIEIYNYKTHDTKHLKTKSTSENKQGVLEDDNSDVADISDSDYMRIKGIVDKKYPGYELASLNIGRDGYIEIEIYNYKTHDTKHLKTKSTSENKQGVAKDDNSEVTDISDSDYMRIKGIVDKKYPGYELSSLNIGPNGHIEIEIYNYKTHDTKHLKTKSTSENKQGVAEEYNAEYDDEAGMADNNLETLDRAVEGIDRLIDSGDNLPEWCQEKIAVAKSMLVAVWDYMYSEESSDEVDPEVDEMFEAMDELAEEMAIKNRVSKDLVWEQFEAMDDRVLYETAAWRRKEGKSKKGGLNAKGVASYRRENPGSKLQMAVTTKPSKLKPGSKAAKRRKSFCARMSGVKGPMKKPNGKPTRKALALRKWNC